MSRLAPPGHDTNARSMTKIAIVAAEFNRGVIDPMVAAAHEEATALGITVEREVRVPGSFELPVVSKAALDKLIDAWRGEHPDTAHLVDGVQPGQQSAGRLLGVSWSVLHGPSRRSLGPRRVHAQRGGALGKVM